MKPAQLAELFARQSLQALKEHPERQHDGDTENANHRAALAHENAAVAWALLVSAGDAHEEDLLRESGTSLEWQDEGEGEDAAEFDAAKAASTLAVGCSGALFPPPARPCATLGRLLVEIGDATNLEFRKAAWALVAAHRRLADRHRRAGWSDVC